MNDGPDPKLAGLFVAERAAPGAPSGAKARVAARLGLPPLPSQGPADPPAPASAGAGPAAAWTLKHAAAVVTAFAVGGLGGALVMASRPPPPRVVYVDRLVEPSTSAAAPTPSTAPAVTQDVAPAAPAKPLPSSRPGPGLAEEQALLDAARVALGRRDGASALAACQRHERRFASGVLEEEREAIAIQALVVLGRVDEARARAGRFRRAHPSSALLPAVDEALGSDAGR